MSTSVKESVFAVCPLQVVYHEVGDRESFEKEGRETRGVSKD